MQTNSQLLTKRDVAERLQICQRSVDYARKKKLLRFCKIGKNVRFRPEDVEEFILSRLIGKKEPPPKKANARMGTGRTQNETDL